MATVIDALVVTLGLDSTQFVNGQKQAGESLTGFRRTSEDESKKIEVAGKRSAEFFGLMKKGALEFLAVFAAGVGTAEFLKFITTVDTTLGRFSERLGINAKDLGAWQGAAVQLGGTADGLSATVASLVTRFANIGITGDTSLIPFIRASIGYLKTAKDGTLDWEDTLIRLAQWAQGKDRARTTAFLQGFIPDPGTITLIEQGEDAVRKLVAERKKLAASDTDIAAAEKRTGEMKKFEGAAIAAGRAITTEITPALDGVLEALTRISSWGAINLPNWRTWMLDILSPLSKLEKLIDRVLGIEHKGTDQSSGATDQSDGQSIGKPLRQGLEQRIFGAKPSSFAAGSDTETYIRTSAIQRGIDPEIAVAVAKSEGLGGRYAGDASSSFGPFQFHMGGMAGGGNSVGGLGDIFQKQTGLDPRDPSTAKSQIDFALDWASKHGWGAWHGWRGSAFAGIGAGVTGQAQGGGGSNVTIGTVVVNSQATDAHGVARDIRGALSRALMASDANAGMV